MCLDSGRLGHQRAVTADGTDALACGWELASSNWLEFCSHSSVRLQKIIYDLFFLF